MSRNGSGTMSVKNTFSPGDTISASTTNANNNDFADELTNSLALDGQSTMTGQLKLANGTAAAPAATFGSDTDNGLYRIGSNQIGGAAGGSQVFTFDSSGLFNEGETVSAKSADYTAVYNDRNKLFVLTGNQTLSLTAAATLKDKWRCYIRNDGTGDWTIDPNSTETIDGETTKTIHPGESGEIRCDGTGFYTVGFAKHDFFDNYLSGLTLSNNATDATNDIDIAVGVAADSTNAVLMRLASSITKQLDAVWAVGTNAGGLDTGTVANGTYHVWLIRRSDTGVVDALFSTSASAPTMPTSYDQKRRIGSILRESSAIVGFTQYGDKFIRSSMSNEMTGLTQVTGAQSITVGVPSGINVGALLRVRSDYGSSGASIMWSSLAETSVAPGSTNGQTLAVASTSTSSTATIVIETNTSSQVRFYTNDTTSHHYCFTYGWIDRRDT